MTPRYRCATCGSSDPDHYVRCNHPGCHDGRDRPFATPTPEPKTMKNNKPVLLLSLPLLLLLALALLLAGCEPPPGRKVIADAPDGDTTATFLGTVDGCRLWSYNRGTFYFANCSSGVVSTHWSKTVNRTPVQYSASSAQQ